MLVTAVNPAHEHADARRAGYAGTTAAAHNDLLPVYLVSNSRTGAEVNLTSVSRIPQAATQYCQTVQHAYQVGGALQADSNYATGLRHAARPRPDAGDAARDGRLRERLLLRQGRARRPRPRAGRLMKGVADAIQTQQRHRADERRGLQAERPGPRHASGLLQRRRQPDRAARLAPTSSPAFAVWGHAAMRLNAGSNVFGTPIDLFEAPFLSGISIIPAPLLRPGTAICLSTHEARVRLKRPMIDKPRGSRGDAFEGDIIMEGADRARQRGPPRLGLRHHRLRRRLIVVARQRHSSPGRPGRRRSACTRTDRAVGREPGARRPAADEDHHAPCTTFSPASGRSSSASPRGRDLHHLGRAASSGTASRSRTPWASFPGSTPRASRRCWRMPSGPRLLAVALEGCRRGDPGGGRELELPGRRRWTNRRAPDREEVGRRSRASPTRRAARRLAR